MARNTNIREIARQSGMSTMTVSRVLRGSEQAKVSDRTRQKVMRVVERLKYQPNIHAKRLFSKRSRVLAMVIPPSDRRAGPAMRVPDMTIESIVPGAVEAALESRYYIMTVVADETFITRRDYLSLFRSRMIDGMLILGACYDEKYFYELIDEEHPVVLLNTHHGKDDVHRIYFDNQGGSAAIARHFVELGHRELGYISGPDRASIGVERRAGFVDVIRSTADAKVHVYDGDFGFESGRIGAGQLLDEHPSITGIACGNDLMALGVQRALADRGMSIPRDISVSGADAMFPHLKPLLTSFSVPLFDVGYQGAKRMIAVLEDPSDDDPAQKIAPSSLCMDVELIIGGTTGPPRRRVE